MPGTAGQPFGKYLLLDRIAAGGMAEIFRAKYVAAAGVTKTVVIKRILPHYAGNPAFVSMFINEAKVAVSLSHGNIAQVFDFGEIDGEYFIAMEYVHGLAVSRLARRARELGVGVPFPIAVYVASEICNGLHYAHTRTDDGGRPLGIVHRDISPQNVLVSFEGQVKIVDFGIAKVRSAGENTTEHGALKGKYLYFSPEQARAKPLDGRSDVFATGIVLYELLTGRRPFEGKTMDVLTRIVKGEFDPPSKYVQGLPPDIEAIVMKAMALRPEDRFESALAMHDALLHYLHTSEPRFTASWLGHFTRHLAGEEAEQSGVRLDVPSSFLLELERWRGNAPATPQPQPKPAVPESVETRAEPRRRDTSRSITLETAAVPGVFGLSGRARLMLGVGAAVALGAAAGALLIFARAPSAYDLDVASWPPGAEVAVDGRPTGQRTPARVAQVSAHEPHRVELLLAGYEPWSAELPPQRSASAAVEARLQQERPSGAGAAEPAPDELPDGPRVELPDGELTLDGRENALGIPPTAAARIRLDPSRAYRLAVDGAAAIAGGRELRSVFYFGERVRGARAASSYGQLLPGAPAELGGVRALYAFIIDADPADNAGALRVVITDVASGRELVLPVHPVRNALVPDRRWGSITGLDSAADYQVSVSGSVDLGADGGPVSRLLYYAEPGEPPPPDGGQGVLAAGTLRRVVNARSLWLMLPDDDRFDNQGSLTVKVSRLGTER